MSSVRINRFLASCGLGSRRACEGIVREGRVVLNKRRVDSLGVRVGPGDEILVDGEPVRPDREMVVVLHKPRGILCTRGDPRGRETVYDLLPDELRHLAHVGRLDRESEGLLVLTNSGHLAQALTHPSTKVDKEYIVHLDHPFGPKDRQAFLRGIETEEGLAQAAEVEVLQPRTVRIVLQQGLKRQIRLMCTAVGHVVKRLIRVRIGSFTAPRLLSGRWKKLTGREIELLRESPKPLRGATLSIAAPPPVRRKRPATAGALRRTRKTEPAQDRTEMPRPRPSASTKRSTAAHSPRSSATQTKGAGRPTAAGKGRPAAKGSSRPAGKSSSRPAAKTSRPATRSRPAQGKSFGTKSGTKTKSSVSRRKGA